MEGNYGGTGKCQHTEKNKPPCDKETKGCRVKYCPICKKIRAKVNMRNLYIRSKCVKRVKIEQDDTWLNG